jgi:hypothetical protein
MTLTLEAEQIRGDLLASGEQLTDIAYILAILDSLPSDYDLFKEVVSAQDMDLAKFKGLLLDRAAQFAGAHGGAFYTQNKSKFRVKKKSNDKTNTCHGCGKVGQYGKHYSVSCLLASDVSKLDLWHKRCGHANYESVVQTSRHVQGMEPLQKEKLAACVTSQLCKSKTLPFGTHERGLKPLEIIYSDVCGPMRTAGLKAWYMLFFCSSLKKIYGTKRAKKAVMLKGTTPISCLCLLPVFNCLLLF